MLTLATTKLHSTREIILWLLGWLNVAVVLIGTILFADAIRLDFSQSPLFNVVFMLVPIVLLILHSVWTLTFWRAFFFILLAMLLGFTSEYLGLNYGVIFGGEYVYPGGLTFLEIPVTVLLYWAAFCYTGYAFVTGMLYWTKREKPRKGRSSFWWVVFLCVIDAYVVLAIDLLMDPIQVWLGNWTWIGGGPYFGVPIGNFIGWFNVAFLVSLIYRTYEYYFSPSSMTLNKKVFFIPAIGYTAMAISMIIMAIRIGMPTLALISGLAMLIPSAINIGLYMRYVGTKRE